MDIQEASLNVSFGLVCVCVSFGMWMLLGFMRRWGLRCCLSGRFVGWLVRLWRLIKMLTSFFGIVFQCAWMCVLCFWHEHDNEVMLVGTADNDDSWLLLLFWLLFCCQLLGVFWFNALYCSIILLAMQNPCYSLGNDLWMRFWIRWLCVCVCVCVCVC